MIRILHKAALLLAAFAFASSAAQALADSPAPAGKPKYRLVLHVSENNPQQWATALNNALMFQKNLGAENTQIEVVANGPGLNMLKAESKAAGAVAGALDRNIDVVACGETMKAMKLTEADLIGGVRVVPGGLIEIVNRQMEGWSYVRP